MRFQIILLELTSDGVPELSTAAEDVWVEAQKLQDGLRSAAVGRGSTILYSAILNAQAASEACCRDEKQKVLR